jgi:hypothetical protein
MDGFDTHTIDRDFLKEDIKQHLKLLEGKLEDLLFEDLKHIEYILRILLIKRSILKIEI